MANIDIGIILIVIATIVGTILLVRNRKKSVRKAYHRFEFGRKVFTAIFAALVAWTFLNSGSPLLIAAAVVAIALATIIIYVEQPHKELV